MDDALQVFEEAFNKLKAVADPVDAEDFHSTSLKDVWDAAKLIEEQLASRRSLRNIRRIESLVSKLRLYSGPVEILCNGTPYLPWVWAPIKLMLQLSGQYLEVLEKLLDAYADIAAVLPRMDRLGDAFHTNPSVCYILSVIYADILEFHRKAYKFLKRRGWRTFFLTSWSSFDIRFKGILESLDKHSHWLDREANAINIVEARQWRTKASDDAEARERQRLDIQFHEALKWLAVDDQEEDLDQLTDRCQPGSCNWLFHQPELLSWMDEAHSIPLLWLKGIPGSGKSVLCSQLIQRLRQEDQSTVAYYFCDSYSSKNTQCAQVLKAIAAQLLRSHRRLAPYVLGGFANHGFTPSVPKLRQLLSNMPCRSTRIIIDGLDEIDTTEHKKIIKELESLVKLREPSCKILVSSREGGDITKLLKSKPVISLSDHQLEVQEAIRIYVESELQGLKDRFQGSTVDIVSQRLISEAGGMFLWARLMISTLDDAHSFEELEDTMAKLPKGLDGAYAKIIGNFKARLSDVNMNKATRILEWIAFARRPLRTHELLDGITLHAGNQVLDETSRQQAGVLELCKPIIEDGPGRTIQFVHFSAKQFLVEKISGPFLRAALGHSNIALSCTMWLSDSFDLFNASVSDHEMQSRLIHRFHGLQSYAYDSWIHHLLSGTRSKALEDSAVVANNQILISKIKGLLPSQRQLTEPQLQALDSQVGSLTGTQTLLDLLKDDPVAYNLVSRILVFRNKVDRSCKDQENITGQQAYESEHDPTHLSKIMHRYRDSVERLLASPDEELLRSFDRRSIQRFRGLHGPLPFSCRYPRCGRIPESFANKTDRDRHEEIHYPRWKCKEIECAFYATGWKTASDLKRHNALYHDSIPVFAMIEAETSTPLRGREAMDNTECKANVAIAKMKFACGGQLLSGKAWGCGSNFSSKTALKAHYATPAGSSCIKALYSETTGGVDLEGAKHNPKKYMFTSVCHGVLNSGETWGCGRSFENDQALKHHWQSRVGILCRQQLFDEVDTRINQLEEQESSEFSLPSRLASLLQIAEAYRKNRGSPTLQPIAYDQPIVVTKDETLNDILRENARKKLTVEVMQEKLKKLKGKGGQSRS